ncbi:hypothetical protein JTB14_029114 [Gonioctena quinquepunctata]|nr:hypothetical protein JTB14_029114 [Gonioctena quinquepunctata]
MSNEEVRKSSRRQRNPPHPDMGMKNKKRKQTMKKNSSEFKAEKRLTEIARKELQIEKKMIEKELELKRAILEEKDGRQVHGV